MVEAMENRGLSTLNGRSHSDSNGEYTYIGPSGMSTIDMAWVNEQAMHLISSFTVDNGCGISDHLPIRVTLVTNIEETTYTRAKTPKLIKLPHWTEEKSTLYKEAMATRRCGLTTTVNEMNERMNSCIVEVIDDLGMHRKVITDNNFQDEPWYNGQCRALRKEMNRASRKGYKVRTMNNKQTFTQARKEFTTYVKEAKETHSKTLQEQLSQAKSGRDFWLKVKRYRKKSFTPCPISTEIWMEFYKNIYPTTDYLWPRFIDCRNLILDAEVTLNEVIKAIREAKTNSPGPDSIKSSFYKALPEQWLWHLVRLFNKILISGEIPDSWCQSEVVMLHKKGDLEATGNYRGIALANSISKIFTSLLASRVSKWSEDSNILPECQSGFRAKRGCDDNIFVLQAKITTVLSKPKGKLYIAFIDFKRAFDSIIHVILWNKLYRAGVSAQLIKVLQDYYRKACAKIRLAKNVKTETIDITEGVIQGDPISATLFILFLHDIEDYFIKSGHHNTQAKMEMGIFADDAYLTAENPIDLQDKLETLSNYCEENGLTVNTDKTKIMICQKGGRQAKINQIKYTEVQLEVVKCFVYLGVPFTKSGLFIKALNYFLTKGQMAIGAIWRVMMASKMNNWKQRTTLFMSIVATSVMYCSGIWALNHVEELDKIQRNFLKNLLFLQRCTPSHLLRLETGTTSLKVNVIKSALCYWEKLQQMTENRYPKRCLLQLKELHNSANNPDNRNWYTMIKHTIDKHGNQNLAANNQADEQRVDKTEIIEKLKISMFNRDVQRARTSKYTKIILKQTDAIQMETYLNLKIPIEITRVIAQLRLANADQQIIIRIKREKYTIDTIQNCILCN